LIEAPTLREQLRTGAAALAQEFEWPKIASATTDFFRWVIEEKTSS
jgi:hypothetical protein